MKKKSASCSFRTSIGGQALIEGILMRGPEKEAVVVRKSDGTLVTKEEEVHFLKEKYPILGWPMVRGTVSFIESMVHGVKALNFAAEQFPEDSEEPSKFEKWLEKTIGTEKFMKLAMGLSVVLGIGLAVVLFMLLPTFLAGLISKSLAPILRSLLEGILRIAIFLGYIWLCSRLKDIKRVWMYHGAEHKTIHCYEKGLELTVENARAQKRAHPRCGTSFLFLVMIVSILVFSLVKWQGAVARMLLRIVLLPVVVGISYELIKFAGRHDNLFTRILSAPGMWLQKLTTAEPDDSMLEVAIASLKLVLPREAGSDQW